MRLIPTFALVLSLLPGSLPARAAAPETRSIWRVSTFTWIKRVRAEPGAPANGHPLRVDPSALVQALDSVELGDAGEPLFARDEVARVAKPMAEALALATPGEDLELLSTWKRGGKFLGSATAVTARVFVQDGRLNLIVHDARVDFIAESLASDKTPVFTFGSRAAAGTAVIQSAGAESPRADWLVLTLPAPAAKAQPAPPVPIATSVPVVAPVPAAAPVPVAAQAPAAPVAAPAEAAAPKPGLLDRLRLLKESRDQNLITEEEYLKRKQEIIQEF